MGNFMYIVALWVFMALDGHHMLISAVYNSFELLPPGVGIEWQKTAVDLTSIVAHTFIIGFKISAPIVTAILLADVGLGILSRTMPQMNAFVIGIPVKILVGMTAMMMLLPMFTSILDNMLVFLNQSLIRVLTNTR
jgi:flagellar biosynthetic protein FliR